MDRRALQQLREFYRTTILLSQRLPLICLGHGAHEHDLVTSPVRIAEIANGETQSAKSRGNRLISTCEVVRPPWTVSADSVGIPDDRLGVVQFAVQLKVVGRCGAEPR